MLKQMRKTLGILLAICFLISMTAAAVSAGPVVVKDKKTIIVIVKDVKTKIFKHPHQSQCQKHGTNNTTTTNTSLGEDANDHDHHHHHDDNNDCWAWSPTKEQWVYVC
jgi:ABC-type Zn2+ transport system substrate-binding protein/surface adhesin